MGETMRLNEQFAMLVLRNGFAIYVLALLVFATAPCSAGTELAAPVTLEDGTVATPFDRCGAADKCGSIKYPNGDELVIYGEGAASGQPYRFHFTFLRGGSEPTVQYDVVAGQNGEYARERDLIATYTMSHGILRLDIYANKDGTVKPRFTKGVAKP